MFGIQDQFRVRGMLSTKGNRSCTAKFWLPKNTVFQLFLSRFLNVCGGPDLDSNRLTKRTVCVHDKRGSKLERRVAVVTSISG